MLLLKFAIQRCLNILNLFSILILLNKCFIQWFWFDVSTKAQIIKSDFLNPKLFYIGSINVNVNECIILLSITLLFTMRKYEECLDAMKVFFWVLKKRSYFIFLKIIFQNFFIFKILISKISEKLSWLSYWVIMCEYCHAHTVTGRLLPSISPILKVMAINYFFETNKHPRKSLSCGWYQLCVLYCCVFVILKPKKISIIKLRMGQKKDKYNWNLYIMI